MTYQNWFLRVTATVALAWGIGGLRADEPEAPIRFFVSSFAAGEDGAIHACELNPNTGEFRHEPVAEDVAQPFFLALSSDKRHLYSIHAAKGFGGAEDEQVAAYSVGEGGRLRLLNRVSTRGSASCYLDVDRKSSTVVVANYLKGSVASYRVERDGALAGPAAWIEHVGSSVDPKRQKGPHAHCIVLSPDDRYALVADLGLDQILIYTVESGRLAPHARQPFVRTRPGAGPRHLTFAPGGQQVYVINELENSVTRFDFFADAGMLVERETLSTLPEGFEGTSYCADVKVTPDGRFVYGTNRGHDSVAVYRRDESGRLSLVEIHPSGGRGPQNLAIAGGGRVLLCANMPGNNVVAFRIDQETGRLEELGAPLSVVGPSCLQIR